MIADDFATVEAEIGLAERFHDGDCCHEARAALARIKARYQEFLDAAARVTDLANSAQRHEDDYLAKKLHVRGFSPLCVTAKDIREALGPAYLGGPLA